MNPKCDLKYLDVYLGPAVGASGPPQLVGRVKSLCAPNKLQIKLDAPEVIRCQQMRFVPRKSVMIWNKLTYRTQIYSVL